MKLVTQSFRWAAAAATLLLALVGCRGHVGTAANSSHSKESIQNIGSDTLVNAAQAWAEQFSEVDPNVSVEVSGGGTGVGIAALINGTADIANCSRRIEPKEVAKAKQASGKEPREFLVGYDGLAVFVHKGNPIETLSLEELAGIYGERGSIGSWSQLGVVIPGKRSDKIIRVSRQNNSGTYQYFRETVVGKKADFKQGSLDMNGSKEVVELIAQTPGAIGYSGLGYATPHVKIVKISKRRGEPGIAPTLASIQDATYPIARPLFMYTPGNSKPVVARYLAWVMSREGQAILRQTGYIPLVQ